MGGPDVEDSIPGRDLGTLLSQDLGMYRVSERPDGSWEWTYFGRSHRGDRFLFSDRFGKDMHAYFIGEE